MEVTVLKRVIIGGIVLLGLLAGIVYFLQPNGFDISFEFKKPDHVLLGKPFELSISLKNNSEKIAKDASVAIALPDGISFVGREPSQRVFEEQLGDLGPASVIQKTFTLIAVSGSQNVKHIDAKLKYNAAGSSARFQNEAGIDIAVGEPAISLAFEAPQKVFSGESFDLKVKYENNSEEDMSNLRLKIEYPPIFQFQKSTVKPTQGNNIWDLGTMKKGEQGEFVISGNVIGQENFFFGFNGTITSSFSGKSYTLNTQTVSLLISSAPLSLRIRANGDPNYIAHAGDTVAYVLTYKNNSNTTLENVSIRATLAGDMYDFQTVETTGAFNSLANSFSWNAANVPALLNVLPSQEGAVTLTIRLKPVFPIKRISDKNFTLKLRGQIESPTVPAETGAVKTLSLSELETKVAGQIKIKTSGYFRDANSGILNSGSYPPKVNQPTQYTIHWTITNYSTDVASVVVSGFLQSGTTFTGKVKSNVDTEPTYNTASGEVSWTIKNITAGKGILSDPIEAIFQVENTPPINRVGQEVALIGETKIEATDTFTDTKLTEISPAISTGIPDDQTVGTDRRIQP